MKTTLTKDDAAGWYLAESDSGTGEFSCVYWDGEKTYLSHDPNHKGYRWSVGWTNFRHLVEAPQPVTNEAARITGPIKVAAPPQPEVIEGRGQVVGESGRWLEQPSTGSIICVWLTREDVFQEGCRYMRCPTFPPLGSK